jgi:hypothetical protein
MSQTAKLWRDTMRVLMHCPKRFSYLVKRMRSLGIHILAVFGSNNCQRSESYAEMAPQPPVVFKIKMKISYLSGLENHVRS